MYIPYIEQRVSSLCTLSKFDMDHDIPGMLKEDHESTKVDIINYVISDPCIYRFDFEKRPYLLTGFSKFCSGYDLCRSDDDRGSMAAMRREM